MFLLKGISNKKNEDNDVLRFPNSIQLVNRHACFDGYNEFLKKRVPNNQTRYMYTSIN